MEEVFTGERGYVHALIDAFGESATVRRPTGDAGGAAPCFEEERARFVPSAAIGREGASRIADGTVSSREPTLLRRREARLEGVLSAVGLSAAPRAALDQLVVAGREYRIEAVEEIRVGGRVAAYRLECARS